MNEIDAHRRKYSRIERERRFLVSMLPLQPAPVRTREITDRYFPETTLRLRRMTERFDGGATEIFKLTQKIPGESDGARQGVITNTYLSRSEYELLAQLSGDELRKTRYSIPPMGVDVFASPLDGLIIAEAEFETDWEMERFRPPDYVVAEVTGDSRFSGGELVLASREQVAEWLTEYGLVLKSHSSSNGNRRCFGRDS